MCFPVPELPDKITFCLIFIKSKLLKIGNFFDYPQVIHLYLNLLNNTYMESWLF